MAANEDTTTLKAVEDLQVGDLVNLAGDPYADEEDMGEFSDGPAEVQYLDSYGPFGITTTAVEFLYEGLEHIVAFPYGYKVKVVGKV